MEPLASAVPAAPPTPAGDARVDPPRIRSGSSAPTPGSTGWRGAVAPLGVGLATVCGCVAVAALDPGDDGVPLCASRAVFGVDCPLCGGLRATNALLRADPSAALDHNVVLAMALPMVTLLWVWWLWRRWRGIEEPATRVPTWAIWTMGVLLVAFGIVRNLGGAAWLRWLHSDLSA